MKATDISEQSRVNKTYGLLHINNLLKGTIEEGIMYIKLRDLPMVRYNNGKNEPNSSQFNNMTEGFGAVDSLPFSETMHKRALLRSIAPSARCLIL